MNVASINKLTLDETTKLAIDSKDDSVLMLIAKSDCDYAKVFVARNRYASNKTLDILSKSVSRSVREAVLENPKTLPSTIKRIRKAS